MSSEKYNKRIEVAYIVVSYNSGHFVRKCIDSISETAKETGLLSAIVIIDNASIDNSREILADIARKESNISVVPLEQNIGFGRANNIGFQTVEADYYVLINVDAWLIADSISSAINAMEHHTNIAVCGLPLVYPDGSPQTYSYKFSAWHRWLLHILGVRAIVAKLARIQIFSYLLSMNAYGREFVRNISKKKISIDNISLEDYTGELRKADWVCGAAMVIAGDFIKESGGFDPAIFLYGEDEDLCMEARRKNRDVMIIDTVPVAHDLGWAGNKSNSNISGYKYQSLSYFIKKNINHSGARWLMLIILPIYVYGWKRAFRISSQLEK